MIYREIRALNYYELLIFGSQKPNKSRNIKNQKTHIATETARWKLTTKMDKPECKQEIALINIRFAAANICYIIINRL